MKIDYTPIFVILLFVIPIGFTLHTCAPIYKSLAEDLFEDSGSDDSSSPSNIIAVKELSSDPKVGIIANPKGKPSLMYVPGKGGYEVTYEENGVLKTKTMNSDPTK
jgi:hypothetical protein